MLPVWSIFKRRSSNLRLSCLTTEISLLLSPIWKCTPEYLSSSQQFSNCGLLAIHQWYVSWFLVGHKTEKMIADKANNFLSTFLNDSFSKEFRAMYLPLFMLTWKPKWSSTFPNKFLRRKPSYSSSTIILPSLWCCAIFLCTLVYKAAGRWWLLQRSTQ